MSREEPPRVAVLLSGGGTTLENLCGRFDQNAPRARVSRVISSRADAFGLERARRRGIPTAVVPSRDFRRTAPDGPSVDWRSFSEAVTAEVDRADATLVCMAGFMCRWFFPERWRGRVLNIHPALLPSFGGAGMYGHHVHEAVAASGVKVSGCTVHFVDDEYDAGPIVLQRTCPVGAQDTPDAIARRVFVEECEAYPAAVDLFLSGRLSVRGRVVHIHDE